MSETAINYRYDEVIFNDNWKRAYGENYWKYREMWAKAPVEKIVTPYPMHLDIEITNVCNLKCPMCARTLLIEKNQFGDPYFIDYKLFKKIIDQVAGKGVYALNLNADGETLLHKDLVKMVAYAKKKGIIDIMFHTNATLLTANIAEGLIDAGLDKLIVSFDAPRKDLYEKIRIGANFEEVVENVKRFVEMRNAKGKILPMVRINMIIMKETLQYQEEMVKFWEPHVDGMGFLGYVNFYDLDEDRHVKIMEFDNRFICEKLWQRLSIQYDGTIKLCHMDEKNLLRLGNINDDTIYDVWHSTIINKFRQMHQNGKIAEIELCSQCPRPYK